MSNHKIVILGDICPDNDYRNLFDTKEYGAFSPEVARTLQDAELAIGNLECPATGNMAPIRKCGPSLRACPEDISVLKKAGLNLLSLANNHILDYGMQGLEDTLTACRKEQIMTVGAEMTEEKAARPCIADVAGKKIGVLSFAEAEFNLADGMMPGANHFDPYLSIEQVRMLKKDCDYVIVLYHGGIEYYKNPSPLLQKKCRSLAGAGADLVLCQHSHCIGTMENYEHSTIVYGQGNTVFGYRDGNPSWNEGLMVTVDLMDHNKVELKLLHAAEAEIIYASEEENQKRLDEIHKDSENICDKAWIKNQWSIFAGQKAAMYLPMLFGRNRVFNKLNRIFHNRLVNLCYSRKKKMITMNLIRCEAHHEVLQTILEDDFFKS